LSREVRPEDIAAALRRLVDVDPDFAELVEALRAWWARVSAAGRA
jgi:hypothetical protein